MAKSVETEVDDRGTTRTLSLSNLDKVLYPSGFTKAQVIDYMARIAPTAVPHLTGRALTFRRYPDGTDTTGFFEKRCPGHRPPWVDVALGPGDRKGGIEYCRIDGTAAMVWAANMAAIELHAPMALADDLDVPRALVFDFDPGAPATIVECARVGLILRKLFARLGLESFPKTSGSKGLQVYVPLNTAVGYDETKGYSRAVAEALERSEPELVVSKQKKEIRKGKVLVDWSQNDYSKTTVATYSLRCRPRPWVSTPLTWKEVEKLERTGDPDSVRFEANDVLKRIDKHGDLFAPVLEMKQRFPRGGDPAEAAEPA
jgi:bifunctional non-homologous end joining protein LigD